MKATINQIFSDISHLNPRTSDVSSLGSFVSKNSQDVADFVFSKIIRLISKDSLAHSIMVENKKFFTDKQLWVIAYELQKNEEYCLELGKRLNREALIEQSKIDKKKDKLSANKAGSQEVLDFVKANGKKLGDYYAFVKKNKAYAKEFYSKKFTMASAEAFIQA